ncbi:uncharacterized protein ACA1_051520 [Acanthamoeba castellanii str. Neff]|uniref:Uncharacterized protein n=1 Tax=Acanthamoeba castellanii (strain ATCC 30010 / Neff) TaxID=1257118 RepID=L8GP10_ACACF|nr:uncharacterized protein ACA1_051520 [Acanthamoeba castellanii str. Neff]ELR14929.1 hypothetical protein ACA1_051520 [Acanthamoeba castellanii str. Neff]
MATKKIRKKPCYELMNWFSLAQIVEMIEAEKRRKQRLEWYLQEVMLEKETLVNEPAMLPWHSRCLILPSELSPVTVTSLLKAPTSLTTAGDWRHGSSEEEQLNFNNSGDDLDQATQLAREQWDPSELWWQDAFPDPLANPTVTYGCPF